MIAIATAIAVVMPWSVAIHLQQPDFWHYFIWVEHLQRFAGENAQHGEPFYYYLAFAPVAAFPWFGLLPAMVAGLRNPPGGPTSRSGLWLLVCWIAMPFLFFSVSNGKLITYILPCFVPLAILLALGLNAADSTARRVTAGLAFNAAVYLVFIAALLLAQYTNLAKAVFAGNETWRFVALVAALSLSALITLAGLFMRSERRVLTAGLSIIPFLFALPFVLPERVMHSKAPEAFLTAAAADLPADAFVATDGFFLRAVTWSLKRQDVYVIGAGGETQYGLDAPDAAGRQLTPARFADQIARVRSAGRDFLLLCRLDCPLRYARSLPPGTTHESFGNFHAWRYRANDR
jgi:4-amino-4-deoxy-L-arabinose transferase